MLCSVSFHGTAYGRSYTVHLDSNRSSIRATFLAASGLVHIVFALSGSVIHDLVAFDHQLSWPALSKKR